MFRMSYIILVLFLSFIMVSVHAPVSAVTTENSELCTLCGGIAGTQCPANLHCSYPIGSTAGFCVPQNYNYSICPNTLQSCKADPYKAIGFGDVNQNGVVNNDDYLQVVASYATSYCPADWTGDNFLDLYDVNVLIASYGNVYPTPQPTTSANTSICGNNVCDPGDYVPCPIGAECIWSGPCPQECVNKDIEIITQCLASDGVWRQFSNSCANSCEQYQASDLLVCTDAIVNECDCGTDRCWTGDTCALIDDVIDN